MRAAWLLRQKGEPVHLVLRVLLQRRKCGVLRSPRVAGDNWPRDRMASCERVLAALMTARCAVSRCSALSTREQPCEWKRSSSLNRLPWSCRACRPNRTGHADLDRAERIPEKSAAIHDGSASMVSQPSRRIMRCVGRWPADPLMLDRSRPRRRDLTSGAAQSSLAAIDSISDTSWRWTVWSLILL